MHREQKHIKHQASKIELIQRCHGGRREAVRRDYVGGLSRPCRDATDPTGPETHIYPLRQSNQDANIELPDIGVNSFFRFVGRISRMCTGGYCCSYLKVNSNNRSHMDVAIVSTGKGGFLSL